MCSGSSASRSRKHSPRTAGRWFRLGVFEVHVSPVDGDQGGGTSKRHVCYVVSDLGEAESELSRQGVAVIPDRQPIPGWARFYIRDPGGNRIEIAERLQPAPGRYGSVRRKLAWILALVCSIMISISTPRSPVRPINESITLYQRLLVNPCLAVLAFIIAVAIERWATGPRSIEFPFKFGVGIFALNFLVQYHCRDCGATGFLISASKTHICPAVLARWHHRELPRSCVPGVRVQLACWVILLLSLTILLFIVWSSA